jgi:hypothetical protein
MVGVYLTSCKGVLTLLAGVIYFAVIFVSNLVTVLIYVVSDQ